ncbi:Hypothetical predicted protein [Octopus vulgaris]|uniref:Uncharacterized protein n=1 Tax=Octopus vulgaris TaxID=6645 RepID=A0AA36AIY0_OCTVU|nr:Hypothetical predicted protein [Octopus vulgaris]
MCFVEFAATYTIGGKDDPDDAVDHIPDVLDGSDDIKGSGNNSDTEEIADKLPKVITLKNSLGCMKKRKRHCIIKFHKEKKEGEGRYRNLLMLYYPWRDEEIDLKADYPSSQEHYESVEAVIHSNEAMFSVNADELDRAYDDLKRMPGMLWPQMWSSNVRKNKTKVLYRKGSCHRKIH